MPPKQQRLFHAFLIVKAERADPRKPAKSNIVYQFPAKPEEDVPRDVEAFCHPDIESLQPKQVMKSEDFTFVLTTSDGARIYGVCLRALPVNKSRHDVGKRLPETMCFISSFPYFAMISHLLRKAQTRNWDSRKSLQGFLEAIYSISPFPLPGEIFHVKEKSMVHRFLRPNDNEYAGGNADMRTLLSRLAAPQLILFISALMSERRVVVIASTLDVLSECIHAAIELLYPFSWQHIFIPVLPKSLLSYACAPMPFVVGVRSDMADELNMLPLSEVVIVNLDLGEVRSHNPMETASVILSMGGANSLKAGQISPRQRRSTDAGGEGWDSMGSGSFNGADEDDWGSLGDGSFNGDDAPIPLRSGGGVKKFDKAKGLLKAASRKAGRMSIVKQGSAMRKDLLGEGKSGAAPQQLERDVETVYEKFKKSTKKDSSSSSYAPNADLSSAFITFNLCMFGDETSFMRLDDKGAMMVDKDLYLRRREADASSGDVDALAFLGIFLQSQMFEQYSKARLSQLQADTSRQRSAISQASQAGGAGSFHGAGSGHIEGLFLKTAAGIAHTRDFSASNCRRVLKRMQEGQVGALEAKVGATVLELTSNTDSKRPFWQMIREVSAAMSDARNYAKITEIIWWRMSDCHGFGTKWRHGWKACLVMVSLLRLPTTSESLVPDTLNHLPLLKHLMHFDSMAGAENNARVRAASRLLYLLINDILRYRRWRSLPLAGRTTVMRVGGSMFPTAPPRSAPMRHNNFRNLHNDLKPPKSVKMAPSSHALRRRASQEDETTRKAAVAKAGASPQVGGRKKQSPSQGDILGLDSPTFSAAASTGAARTPFDDDWGSDASSAASTPATTPAPAPAGWQTFGDDGDGGDGGSGSGVGVGEPAAAGAGDDGFGSVEAGAVAAGAGGGAEKTVKAGDKVLSIEEIKQGLIRFYKHTNPSRVGQVDSIMERYRGQEHEIPKMIYATLAKSKAAVQPQQAAAAPAAPAAAPLISGDLAGLSLAPAPAGAAPAAKPAMVAGGKFASQPSMPLGPTGLGGLAAAPVDVFGSMAHLEQHRQVATFQEQQQKKMQQQQKAGRPGGRLFASTPNNVFAAVPGMGTPMGMGKGGGKGMGKGMGTQIPLQVSRALWQTASKWQ
jgi:hypothetical protein